MTHPREPEGAPSAPASAAASPGEQAPAPPAGWGQPPQGWAAPAGSAGPAGWTAPGGWPAPPPPQGRPGLAVAALVLGILPVLGGVLGIVLGLVGRSQARKRGQPGATMATVGAVLGALWLVGLSAAVVHGATHDAQRDDAGAVEAGGSSSSFDVQVGDCMRSLPEGTVTDVDLVPCTEPHDGEAYAAFDLAGDGYPGDDAVSRDAESGCRDRFQGFVGIPYQDSVQDVLFLHPTRRSWALGRDRTVLCVLQTQGVTGSARDSRK